MRPKFDPTTHVPLRASIPIGLLPETARMRETMYVTHYVPFRSVCVNTLPRRAK